jgi:3-hydroxyacyl-CoA dehydrogenase/enoyl-CoA hydratase/3-hydroxybutyryl-CoA epimerase
VLGLGFPAYLGGPFRLIDQEGAEEITKRMRDLAYRFGSRFAPTDRLVEHEEKGTSFHS